jgi:hypothetical protein
MFVAVWGFCGSLAASSPILNLRFPNLDIFSKERPLSLPPPPPDKEKGEPGMLPSSAENAYPGQGIPPAPIPSQSGPSTPAETFPYREVLGQVVCLSDFPLDDAGAIRSEIRNLQKDLTDYLGIPESNEKVILCLFRQRESYTAFLKRNCPQAPTNRPALYIKDNGPGYVFLQFDDKLILNLRHEMTHALLNSTHKNIPIWLDEGLAKYFETPAGERGNANPFLEPVANRAESFFTPVPSLPGLERLKEIGDMGPTQYRNAWAWIHFLIHYSPKTQQILSRYLQTLRTENQSGIDVKQAAEFQKTAPLTTLLKSEFPGYKKEYRAHFAEWAKR